ncbi:NADH dehydrogenase subunit 5 [Niallia circulans]|uniref:NADH dehydrogenase subunit 5 n=1 Tax=Niallia circulans TaxID=1397 RepID=UPI00300BE49A
MFLLHSMPSLLLVFFMMIIVSMLSGLLFLHPKVPLSYVRVHIWIVSFPPLIALIALMNPNGIENAGPFHMDSLAWLMTFFVLAIGLIVQRFSIRYLMGDRSYRKYFTLFTFTTTAASIAWLSGDLRLLVLFWGATLAGLTLLIRLNNGWKVAAESSKVSGYHFLIGWVSLLLAAIWLSHSTGSWQLSTALSIDNSAGISAWERTGINLLIVLAVIIPAAQWPFQRWLVESVVAPTPVSAIMHAGIVNAGGIMLTRFSPLFNGDLAPTLLLLLFAGISVLVGTGISLVQVDYKRQLVGSTIGQMGFMLIQCALGAYVAAIIHLILHGLFKATLFLQSGSAVRRKEESNYRKKQPAFLWTIAGWILSITVGLVFWLQAPREGYQIISSLILVWSVSISWRQLVAFGEGSIGRIVGLIFVGGTAAIYSFIHHFFYDILQTAVFKGSQPPLAVVIIVGCLLLVGTAIGAIASRNRSSIFFTVLYLWLVRLGEAKPKAVESHPSYLKQQLP